MNLTPEQRLQRTHVRLMRDDATMAYSSILMVGETKIVDDIPTACTNGRDTFYGRAFIEGLTDKQLAGLVLHENKHKLYQHGFLWKHLVKDDARLANMAMDYVINLEIADMAKLHPELLELPPDGLLDAQYRGMDTGAVFRALKQSDDGGGGSGDSEGFDEHEFGTLSEEDKEAFGKEIEQAIRQGAILAKKLGGGIDKAFTELMTPQVDWREQLADYMKSSTSGKTDSTWRKPNRRWLQHDMYLPSTIAEAMGPLVVIWDSSGSMRERVSPILTEIVSLCENVAPELLHLIACDCMIQSHEVFSQDSLGLIRDIKSIAGGGGTDMRVAFKYVEDNRLNPELILVLTDGETPYPKTIPCPTLWAITEKNVTAPIGTTIHITI